MDRRKTLSIAPRTQVPGWSPVRYHLRPLSSPWASKYDKPDPLLLWTRIVLSYDIINNPKLSPLFHQRIFHTESIRAGFYFCCFLLPEEQNFPWRCHSQNTKLRHCCYQCKSGRELANLELKKTAHCKTHHLQDPPWNILNQKEQLQLKFSLSAEPWGCRSVTSWVNQEGNME